MSERGGASASWVNSLGKLFDTYDRQARLYPAIIAFTPAIYSTIFLFPGVVSTISHATATALVSVCVLFMVANIARAQGKRIEPKLLKKWDGWPTSTLLRHRDATIDSHTKTRYHAALSALAKDLRLPSAADEMNAPEAADEVYRSATKKLIEARRGDKYKLILKENISYGFRRNLLGLKPIALSVLAIAITLTLLGAWIQMGQSISLRSAIAAIKAYPHMPVLLGIDVLLLGVWVAVINEAFVRHSAVEYAEALFKSLEKRR